MLIPVLSSLTVGYVHVYIETERYIVTTVWKFHF